MKALIRQQELIIESVWESLGIQADGQPLTHTAYYGGAYALCDNAPVDSIATDYDISEVTESVPTGEVDGNGAEIMAERTRKVATLNLARYAARKALEAIDAEDLTNLGDSNA